MNIFEKTQTLPVRSTLFKTSKMKKSHDYSWASKHTNNRVKNEVVKFIAPIAGCGGDLWLVEYASGPHKGEKSCFGAEELCAVKQNAKTKSITITSFYYKTSRKSIKVLEYSKTINTVKSVSTKVLDAKINALKGCDKFFVIEDFSGLSQKELHNIDQRLNREYYNARKYFRM